MLDEESGTCVTADTTCSDGSTFDQATGKCVPDTEVVCGEKTEPNADGICVPATDEICGPKTAADDQGRCVIQPETCGAGSELDPNTNECVPAEAACGTGLALDSESMTCVPTADVCDAGTEFDEESGLCLPDACQEGEMVVNGVCLNPAEELVQNPDVTESENNDPALGGTAQDLTVPNIGDGKTVFTGTIGAPSDIDGDGSADQDLDVFKFTGSVGQFLNVGVQSLGAPAPGFIIEGPNGYERWSTVGTQPNPARQLVLPYDGDYTITVLPQLKMESNDYDPIGGDDWDYVGWVE